MHNPEESFRVGTAREVEPTFYMLFGCFERLENDSLTFVRTTRVGMLGYQCGVYSLTPWLKDSERTRVRQHKRQRERERATEIGDVHIMQLRKYLCITTCSSNCIDLCVIVLMQIESVYV